VQKDETASAALDTAHSHSIADPGHTHSGTLSDGSVDLLQVDGTILGINFGTSYRGIMRSVGVNPGFDNRFAHVSSGTVSIAASPSGITGTDATGGGQPVSVVPPSIAVTYLIKE